MPISRPFYWGLRGIRSNGRKPWEAELKLMEAAYIHMVRVSEFAWSRMEPREGQYDFDWLERAVALAAKHGMGGGGEHSQRRPACLAHARVSGHAAGDRGKREGGTATAIASRALSPARATAN